MPVLAVDNTGIKISSVMRSVPGYYKCKGSDVNIRSGTNYLIVGRLNYGTRVYVYFISNGSGVCVGEKVAVGCEIGNSRAKGGINAFINDYRTPACHPTRQSYY